MHYVEFAFGLTNDVAAGELECKLPLECDVN